MTSLQLITLIGDVLVRIDTRRGSLPPGSAERLRLDEFRRTLSGQQLRLAELVFDENTPAYAAAADRLLAINATLGASIDDVNRTAESFAALAGLAAAVDELILLAAG